MRPPVLVVMVVLSACGCRHAASGTAPCTVEGAAAEGRCAPSVTEEVREQPGRAPGTVCAPGEACELPSVPKCPPTAPEKAACRTPEIHVTVPPPKVVIRREEKAPAAPPAAAPRPGNEVMLVPTTVYVPYARMTPTGPATMVPLNMTPGAPPAAAPCANPPSAPPPAAAPCAPPPAAVPCAPGAPSCAAPTAATLTAGAAPGPTIESLNRRCSDLETKIDTLIEALNKSRSNK